jgi:hypothetical protein
MNQFLTCSRGCNSSRQRRQFESVWSELVGACFPSLQTGVHVGSPSLVPPCGVASNTAANADERGQLRPKLRPPAGGLLPLASEPAALQPGAPSSLCPGMRQYGELRVRSAVGAVCGTLLLQSRAARTDRASHALLSSAAGGSDPFGWVWSRLSRSSAARCGRP